MTFTELMERVFALEQRVCDLEAKKRAKAPPKPRQKPEDFLEELQGAFPNIPDFNHEVLKAKRWLQLHGKGRQFTKRFLANWLEKADEVVPETAIPKEIGPFDKRRFIRPYQPPDPIPEAARGPRSKEVEAMLAKLTSRMDG